MTLTPCLCGPQHHVFCPACRRLRCGTTCCTCCRTLGREVVSAVRIRDAWCIAACSPCPAVRRYRSACPSLSPLQPNYICAWTAARAKSRTYRTRRRLFQHCRDPLRLETYVLLLRAVWQHSRNFATSCPTSCSTAPPGLAKPRPSWRLLATSTGESAVLPS